MENRKPTPKQTFYYINASTSEMIEYLIKINKADDRLIQALEEVLIIVHEKECE